MDFRVFANIIHKHIHKIDVFMAGLINKSASYDIVDTKHISNWRRPKGKGGSDAYRNLFQDISEFDKEGFITFFTNETYINWRNIQAEFNDRGSDTVNCETASQEEFSKSVMLQFMKILGIVEDIVNTPVDAKKLEELKAQYPSLGKRGKARLSFLPKQNRISRGAYEIVMCLFGKWGKGRLDCLANQYSNISRSALEVIMRRYVRHTFDITPPEAGEIIKLSKIAHKNLLKILKKDQNILLIGYGGCGKSTALRHLYLKIPGKTVYIRMSTLNRDYIEWKKEHPKGDPENNIVEVMLKSFDDTKTIFLDGADESVACIEDKEFIQRITKFFFDNGISFIISTRVDHFGGAKKLREDYFLTDVQQRVYTCETEGFDDVRDFVAAAMLVKQLRVKDTRFNKYWPEGIKEKEYRRILRNANIENNNVGSSNVENNNIIKSNILQIPLFSRYAKTLVLDENDLPLAHKGLTLKSAISTIVKWECYDFISRNSPSGQRKRAVEEYEGCIIRYLKEVALGMVKNRGIDDLFISDYERLRKEYIDDRIDEFINNHHDYGVEHPDYINAGLLDECEKLKTNASLCLLKKADAEKNSAGSIVFEHDTFLWFFLAKRMADADLVDKKNSKLREKFSICVKYKSFVSEYVKQLWDTKKKSILLNYVEPDISMINKNEFVYYDYFVNHLYRITQIDGVSISPGGLTHVARIMPCILVKCDSNLNASTIWIEEYIQEKEKLLQRKQVNMGALLNPLWSEIYVLRQDGFPVTPVGKIHNIAEIHKLFKKRSSNSISNQEVNIIWSAYEIHKEMYGEALDVISVLAQMYLVSLEYVDGNVNKETAKKRLVFLKEQIEFFDEKSCENGNDEHFSNWLEQGYYEVRSLHRRFHTLIMTRGISKKFLDDNALTIFMDVIVNLYDDINYFYYKVKRKNLKIGLDVIFDIGGMGNELKIMCLIKGRDYKAAISLLREAGIYNSVFYTHRLYLLVLCLIRTNENQNEIDVILDEISALKEGESSDIMEKRTSITVSELKMINYHFNGNYTALIKLAEENISIYKDIGCAKRVEACEYLLYEDNTKKEAYNWLMNESIMIGIEPCYMRIEW